MTFKESYEYIIKILESYIEQNLNDDSLISLLSDIDCDVWNDDEPNDPATIDDLRKQLGKYKKNEKELYSENEILLGLRDFLILYKEKYGYNLDNCINFISHK